MWLSVMPQKDVLPPLIPPPSTADSVLSGWVNPVYLSEAAQKQIQQKFEADGSVLLHAFLKADVAKKVRQTGSN